MLLVGPAAAQSVGGPPNVVLIVADDMGYGGLSAYGSPDARTPHLDALAARGVRLTNFYAGGPVCTPNRYALLTGTQTYRAGDPKLLRALEPVDRNSGIADSTFTIADGLAFAGYETAMIGKWHLGHGRMLEFNAPDTKYHPLRHGFDSFFGVLAGTIDYNTHWNKTKYLDWWVARQRRPQDSLLYATHVFGDRAVDFLDDHAGAGTSEPPFFLYLPFTAPHHGATVSTVLWRQNQLPIGEEDEYLSRFDDLYPDDRNVRKRHLAMTAVLDDEIGRIVDALERNGLMEHTIVWFVSDNGGSVRHGGSNGPWRGEKGDPYEGGIRVPAMVVWEGHIDPGVSAQIAGSIDVLTTTASLLGYPLPRFTDGIDFSGHLLGGPRIERGIAVPNAVLGDAVRLRNWKLVRHYDDDGQPLPPELYDLATDPGETTNRANAYPDTVDVLMALLPYNRGTGGEAVGAVSSADGLSAPAAAPAHAPTTAAAAPNPFSGRTTLSFSIAEGADVRLAVYDVLGREVAVLVDGYAEAGAHRAVFDARGLAAGTYVYRLTAGSAVQTGRLVLAR
jgi:arylsulfatase A-like enzyme